MLEDCFTENLGAYDIETAFYKTDHPIVYACALVSAKGDHIDCLFPINGDEVVSSTGRKAKYLCHGDGSPDLEDLKRNMVFMIDAIGDRIRQLRVRGTQNGMGYDNPVLNKIPGVFSIGCDNACPETIPFRRGIVDSHGRQASPDIGSDLDLYWMSNYLTDFINDQKLETIAAFCDRFFNVDFSFTKILNYSQIDELVDRALQGDRKATYELAVYNYDDAIVTYEIVKIFYPILSNIARICQTPIFHALNDSAKKVALNYSYRKSFSALHQVVDMSKYSNFKDNREMNIHIGNKLTQSCSVKKSSSAKKWNVYRGAVEDVLVAYYPFANHVRDVLMQDPVRKEMLELAEKTAREGNPVEAYMYHKVIEAWTGELLYDLKTAIHPSMMKEDRKSSEPKDQKKPKSRYWPTHPNVIRGKYSELNKEDIQEIFDSNLEENISKVFRDTTVINHHDNLFFLKGISEEEASRRGFITFGKAGILSLGKGAIIHKLRDEVLSSGVKIPSKKKRAEEPGKNRNSAFEIRVAYDFLEEYFQDPAKALQLLHKNAQELVQRKVSSKDLLRKVTVRELPKHMDPDQQDRRSNIIKDVFRAKKGEEITYLLISPDDKNEAYLRYDPVEDTLDATMEPAWHIYQHEIFIREESLIPRILKALFGTKPNQGEASRILCEGTADELVEFANQHLKVL